MQLFVGKLMMSIRCLGNRDVQAFTVVFTDHDIQITGKFHAIFGKHTLRVTDEFLLKGFVLPTRSHDLSNCLVMVSHECTPLLTNLS